MTDRPQMKHGGKRTSIPPRIAKPILCPPYAIIPHPDRKGMWVVTDWRVLILPCAGCGSKKGELCQDIYAEDGKGRYSAGMHISRRGHLNPQRRLQLITELAADRSIRFPQARDWLGRVAEDLLSGDVE